MRAMAESSKSCTRIEKFVYKVLGKYLRISDQSVLDSAYNAEIKALEPRLILKPMRCRQSSMSSRRRMRAQKRSSRKK